MSSPLRGAVIFKSRYGATRQYSTWLGDRLNLLVFDPDSRAIPLDRLDYLLIGTSVYFGKMLIKRWLARHREELKGKAIFLFVVCATPSSEREKQRAIIRKNVPPGLAPEERIFFLPGRLTVDKLSWRHKMILRMAGRMEKDPVRKAAISHDTDAVEPAHLAGILQEVEGVLAASAQAAQAQTRG